MKTLSLLLLTLTTAGALSHFEPEEKPLLRCR
jgi:hypothetical protein